MDAARQSPLAPALRRPHQPVALDRRRAPAQSRNVLLRTCESAPRPRRQGTRRSSATGRPSRERHRARVPLRRTLPAVGEHAHPQRARLPDARRRHPAPLDAAVHVEAGRRRARLLRRRRPRQGVHQDRRHGVHERADLRAAAQPPSVDLPRRDQLVLVGGGPDRAGRRRHRTDAAHRQRAASLRETLDAARAADLARSVAGSCRASRPSTGRARWEPARTRSRSRRIRRSAIRSYRSSPRRAATRAAATLPADTALYWRVRANDENGTGLNWSPTQQFRRALAAPAPAADNPTGGETIPVLSWSPVEGAVSYDMHVEQADGTKRDFTMRSTAFTPVVFYGTGVWHWQVRANFKFGSSVRLERLLGRAAIQPPDRHADRPEDHQGRRRALLSWTPTAMARQYKVQVSDVRQLHHGHRAGDDEQHELGAEDGQRGVPVEHEALLARRHRRRGQQRSAAGRRARSASRRSCACGSAGARGRDIAGRSA